MLFCRFVCILPFDMKAFLFLFLSCFYSFCASAGGGVSSAEKVHLLPVKKAINSIVIVTAMDKDDNVLEGIGVIVEDLHGRVGVLTGFHFFSEMVYNGSVRSIAVYNNARRFFEVKRLIDADAVNDLIFLGVDKDLTESGRLAPLRLADEVTDKDLLFYTERAYLSYPWFKTHKVEFNTPVLFRHDFVLSRPRIDTIGSIIINQKQELVSIIFSSSQYTLHGPLLKDIKQFLSLTPFFGRGPSSSGFSIFFRGSVKIGRKLLYHSALEGHKKARHEIIQQSNESFEDFEAFVRSTEDKSSLDLSLLKKQWESFLETAARWNPDVYLKLLWLKKKAGELNEEEKERQWEFLNRADFMRETYLHNHPHFAYLLGSMYLLLDRKNLALYQIKKAVTQGYVPAILEKLMRDILSSIFHLKKLAEWDYAPAQQFLSKVSQTPEEIESIFKEYNLDGVISVFPQQQKLDGGVWSRFLKTYREVADFIKYSPVYGFFVEKLSLGKVASPFDNLSDELLDRLYTTVFSDYFLHSMRNLRSSMEEFNALVEKGHVPPTLDPKTLIKEDLKGLSFPSPERMDQRCKQVFEEHFTSSD